MAASNVIVVKQAVLKLGPTASSKDYSCQVTSAALVPTEQNVDSLDTFCGPTGSRVAPSTWDLTVTILQDQGAIDSLVAYAYTNDGTNGVDFELSGIGVTGSTVKFVGLVGIRGLQVGGEAGVALQATGTWPCQGKPTATFTPPVGTLDAEETDAELQPA